MDTVDALQLALGEFLRAAVVRDEHAFLDPRIRFVGFARHDFFGFALLVELAAVFGALEFEQAFLGAVLLEHRGHFGERLDGIVAGFHHLHCLAVGDALRYVHDTAVEIPAEQVGLLVEFHHAGECAAVYALVQAANSARELFGEHGHCGPRQVLRVAAFQRLFVEFAPFGYVVAHVGDMHAEPEAVCGTFHADGVVVVHGAIGVDAEHVELAVIDASLEILAAGFLDAFDKLLDGGGEVLGQVALFHELRLDFVPAHVHRLGAAVNLREVAVLEFRVRVQREVDLLAFLARRLPAVAHLVHLAGVDVVHFPLLVTDLVQYATLDAGLAILVVLPAAACTQTAVVLDALLRELAAAFLVLLFERFSVAELVFLVAGALQKPALHHVGEHLLEGHLLLFGQPERSAELASDHRFVTQYCNNLFFAG